MKKKALVALLSASLVAVFFLHIEWTSTENGILLIIDGREIDFFGTVNNQVNRLTRSCNAVTRLTPSQEKYYIALSLIKNYSPPNSMSAMIASAWTVESWTLVEVEFADLLPAVVLIQTNENQSYIVPNAVWSGYTIPWKSAPYIRQYISRNGVGVPQSLTECFEPKSQSFQ